MAAPPGQARSAARTVRRLFAPAVLGVLLVAGLTARPAGAATAPTSKAQEARGLAEEVCEQMVHDAVVSALGGHPLPGPQVGAWQGTRYTCTYPLTGGQFVIRVDTFTKPKLARHAYTAALKKSHVDQKLLGIGQAAFLSRNGQVVSQKDLFVLTADPSGIPRKSQRSNVALTAAETVLSCWAGTGS